MKRYLLLGFLISPMVFSCTTKPPAPSVIEKQVFKVDSVETLTVKAVEKDTTSRKVVTRFEREITRPGATFVNAVGLDSLKEVGAVVDTANGFTSVLIYNQKTGQIKQHISAPPVNEKYSGYSDIQEFKGRLQALEQEYSKAGSVAVEKVYNAVYPTEEKKTGFKRFIWWFLIAFFVLVLLGWILRRVASVRWLQKKE